MSAAADARGLKRVCVSCGGRFYDMNKRPINCPGCGTEFSGEIKLKGRRGRVPAEAEAIKEKAKIAPVANDDQDSDVEIRDDGVVSLEDVAAIEDADLDGEDDIASLEDIEDEEDLDVPVKDDKE
ncbi:MAG: TIGR02300 family protein [Alphaproteobacteria bacterium]